MQSKQRDQHNQHAVKLMLNKSCIMIRLNWNSQSSNSPMVWPQGHETWQCLTRMTWILLQKSQRASERKNSWKVRGLGYFVSAACGVLKLFCEMCQQYQYFPRRWIDSKHDQPVCKNHGQMVFMITTFYKKVSGEINSAVIHGKCVSEILKTEAKICTPSFILLKF